MRASETMKTRRLTRVKWKKTNNGRPREGTKRRTYPSNTICTSLWISVKRSTCVEEGNITKPATRADATPSSTEESNEETPARTRKEKCLLSIVHSRLRSLIVSFEVPRTLGYVSVSRTGVRLREFSLCGRYSSAAASAVRREEREIFGSGRAGGSRGAKRDTGFVEVGELRIEGARWRRGGASFMRTAARAERAVGRAAAHARVHGSGCRRRVVSLGLVFVLVLYYSCVLGTAIDVNTEAELFIEGGRSVGSSESAASSSWGAASLRLRDGWLMSAAVGARRAGEGGGRREGVTTYVESG
ncbi:hypothetical protein C8J57DRAFT_1668229 [Mycena rebaudengoi]|nr:hypothetical protein C8J57DRAFT_1668229 [Mycena rebaudengoi]